MIGPEPTRILIVDDHPIVRQGYQQLLEVHSDLVVCGSAASTAEAVERVEALRPHLVIVDITLKDSSGIELVSKLRSSHPQLKLLVISAHADHLYAERALQVGALGYVNKQEATQKLVDAVRQVMSGEVFVSPEITNRLLKQRVPNPGQTPPASPIERLTNRELQVYEMVGRGQTTRQIAAILDLSPKTIERYKENIKRKLAMENATELIQQATRWVLDDA